MFIIKIYKLLVFNLEIKRKVRKKKLFSLQKFSEFNPDAFPCRRNDTCICILRIPCFVSIICRPTNMKSGHRLYDTLLYFWITCSSLPPPQKKRESGIRTMLPTARLGQMARCPPSPLHQDVIMNENRKKTCMYIHIYIN